MKLEKLLTTSVVSVMCLNSLHLDLLQGQDPGTVVHFEDVPPGHEDFWCNDKSRGVA